MNQDEAFLADILAHPDDTDLRRIYADWLEEQGDPRAEYLRLQSALAGLPPKDPAAARLEERMQVVRESIDHDWTAAVDRTRISRCQGQRQPTFKFQCPKRWEALAPTADTRVRFCDACQKPVYHCDNVQDASDHATAGHCVARGSFVPREGEGSTFTMVLGRPDAEGLLRRRFPVGTLVQVTGGRYEGKCGVVARVNRGGKTLAVTFRDGKATKPENVPAQHIKERMPSATLSTDTLDPKDT